MGTAAMTMEGCRREPPGRLLRRLGTALLALALGACVLPHKPAPPPAQLDAARLDLRGLQVPAADAQWWNAFADPQLAQLLLKAQAQNPTLAEAQARVRAAQAQVALARAGLLPAAGASASADRGRLPAHFVVPPPFAGHVGWIGLADASLDWTVDVWGRQAAVVEAQADEAQAARLQLAQARLLIESALVQAYIERQRAASVAALAARAVQAREQLLALEQLRADSGLDSRIPQQMAAAALPAARNDVLQADAAAALAQHALAALSGSAAVPPAAPRLDFDAVIALPQQVPVNLLARRPDVIAARLQLAAAQARCREALAAYYPTVDLSALAGVASFGLSDLFRSSSRAWSAGGAISLPLFDGGRLHAQQDAAEALRDARVAAYNETVLRAVQQAADQLSLIQALDRERSEQRGALEASERARQLDQWRSAAALEDRRPLLRAELALIEAQSTDLQYAAELALARVRLLLALGGGFDPAAESRS